jgi:hypothetical protein
MTAKLARVVRGSVRVGQPVPHRHHCTRSLPDISPSVWGAADKQPLLPPGPLPPPTACLSPPGPEPRPHAVRPGSDRLIAVSTTRRRQRATQPPSPNHDEGGRAAEYQRLGRLENAAPPSAALRQRAAPPPAVAANPPPRLTTPPAGSRPMERRCKPPERRRPPPTPTPNGQVRGPVRPAGHGLAGRAAKPFSLARLARRPAYPAALPSGCQLGTASSAYARWGWRPTQQLRIRILNPAVPAAGPSSSTCDQPLPWLHVRLL